LSESIGKLMIRIIRNAISLERFPHKKRLRVSDATEKTIEVTRGRNDHTPSHAVFTSRHSPFACDGAHIALKTVYLLTLRVMSDCCAQTDTLRRICSTALHKIDSG